jgi:uncharacterized protein (DUF433 family)
MTQKIAIVNRGRGLQLSTSRVTVQDLVPYFQQGETADEIMRWIPSLTADEIAVVREYYYSHQAELDEQDRAIRERTAERIRQQRLRFPEATATPEERLSRLQRLLQEKRQERNGEGHSG